MTEFERLLMQGQLAQLEAEREIIRAEMLRIHKQIIAGEPGVIEQLEAERRLSELRARYDSLDQECARLANLC